MTLLKALERRIDRSSIRRRHIGELLTIKESLLSRIFAGQRPTPGRFIPRATAALDLLIVAREHAEEAHARVLKAWPRIDERCK